LSRYQVPSSIAFFESLSYKALSTFSGSPVVVRNPYLIVPSV
jgi:hypothetical protein